MPNMVMAHRTEKHDLCFCIWKIANFLISGKELDIQMLNVCLDR